MSIQESIHQLSLLFGTVSSKLSWEGGNAGGGGEKEGKGGLISFVHNDLLVYLQVKWSKSDHLFCV